MPARAAPPPPPSESQPHRVPLGFDSHDQALCVDHHSDASRILHRGLHSQRMHSISFEPVATPTAACQLDLMNDVSCLYEHPFASSPAQQPEAVGAAP